MTKAEHKELGDWRELFVRVLTADYPLLPAPTWGQDVAYVAFVLDGLVADKSLEHEPGQRHAGQPGHEDHGLHGVAHGGHDGTDDEQDEGGEEQDVR